MVIAKYSKYFIFFMALVTFSHFCRGQSDHKVALVLSGGAAKGLAHIPLIKALDSLKIQPDVVIGNSMGSVVGGLYAMGYSGKEIEQLADTIDWDNMLSNKIPFNFVNPFEKDEYSKYFVELPVSDWNVEIPLGVIEGQEISLLLNRLSQKIGIETDFDKFPIPFRCVATDLISGELVVFSEGNIATAMRASFAIPTVFTPVTMGDKLLVDGGVLNNFPTDIAEELGVDFIIGSDVSGGLADRPESMMKVLVKSSMISAKSFNDKQRTKCDLLIDHVDHIEYETSDFYKATEIMKNGERAVQNSISQLVEVSKLMNEADSGSLDVPKNTFFDISDVKLEGLTVSNRNLLQGRSLLDSTSTSLEDIEKIIRISYGTRLFDQLNYELESNEVGYDLKILAEERGNNYVKGGFHFDTERGAGIVVNFTKRDFIGENSRSLMSLDLAENPKIRLQHQQYFKDPKWWYRVEGFRERVEQNTYVDGERSGDFQFDYTEFTATIYRDISNYTSLSTGIIYNRDSYTPGISATAKNISKDSLTDEIIKYRFQNIGNRSSIYHNSLNKRYFPTHGIEARMSVSYYPFSDVSINWFSTQREDISTQLRHIWQYEAYGSFNISLTDKVTMRSGIRAGSFYSNDERFFELGVIRFFVLGGIDPRANKQYVNFAGLREGELPVSQFLMGNLALQWELFNNIYLTPSINVAAAGNDDPHTFLKGLGRFNSNWQEDLMSSWISSMDMSVGIMTPIGPIQLQASKVNQVDDLRYYLSLGYFLF